MLSMLLRRSSIGITVDTYGHWSEDPRGPVGRHTGRARASFRDRHACPRPRADESVTGRASGRADGMDDVVDAGKLLGDDQAPSVHDEFAGFGGVQCSKVGVNPS